MESLRRWRMRFSDTAPAPSRSHRPGCESPELVGRVHRQADDVLRKRDLGRILRADEARHNAVRWQLVLHLLGLQRGEEPAAGDRLKIGRAAWRERVCQYVYISVVAVSLKKKYKTI